MNQRIKNQFDLSGKVALITGASKGIGESIARGMAEYGAKVVVSSRSQESVDAVAKSFCDDGLEAKGIACHVGDEAQLEQLVLKTVKHYGGIDILVNNAAINPFYGNLEETDNSLFDKIMDVNVKAAFTLSNLCFGHMKKRGKGSIINIASVEGLKPSHGLGLYSVSKAALIMLTKVQAGEWGKAGIRSNVICPGLIQTKFSAALWNNEGLLDQLTRHLPAGRMALPDEMAGLACFLASPASSYCTGAVFTADGGHMIAGGFNT